MSRAKDDAANYWDKPKRTKPYAVVEPGRSRMLWKPSQVTYSVPCYTRDIQPGYRLGYCEWASREFDTLPEGQPRYFLGTVKRLIGTADDSYMEIVFDDAELLSVICSVKQNLKFCIPAERPGAKSPAPASPKKRPSKPSGPRGVRS